MISVEEGVLTAGAAGIGFMTAGGFNEPYFTGLFGVVMVPLWLWIGIVWGYGGATLPNR